ncbi:restriction endonuclease subunit S [Acinetobacter indicus]|uniref:restriction endonuclease subunit S n=1 Tax=Acinetobacter indicus TaxID=756892 RepID=UPI000CEBD6C6|nr:restriction endonuclease subunit S [Acinetobacter indicus]
MTTPKLRFKEFDGCWVEKIISEIADVRGGKRLPKGYSLQEENNGFPYITVTDMENGTVNLEKIRYVPLEAIDQIKRYRISVDEIYISVAGTLGLVGIIPQELNNANLTENADKLTNIKCNQFYLLYYLNNGSLSKLIDSVSTIGAQPKLALYAIQGMPIFLPSLDEQTKIASFLSAVDEKISQLTQKHALLSQYKQGMMQKLFSQQLRFKADDGSEFGEWEEKTLIDSVDTNIKWSFTGGPFGSNLKSEDYTELGIRIIQLQNIGDGAFLNDYKIYTSPEKANELLSCNIYPDEILISKMGDPVARCCIVPKHHDRYVMCSDGIRLVVDKKNYSSIFMFYQINYQDFRQSASDVSTGSTRKRIGLSDLKQLPIKVPCLEEQTKIANFLSAIDQKIEVVAQQIEQAKTWKKGLLQQMFV